MAAIINATKSMARKLKGHINNKLFVEEICNKTTQIKTTAHVVKIRARVSAEKNKTLQIKIDHF